MEYLEFLLKLVDINLMIFVITYICMWATEVKVKASKAVYNIVKAWVYVTFISTFISAIIKIMVAIWS